MEGKKTVTYHFVEPTTTSSTAVANESSNLVVIYQAGIFSATLPKDCGPIAIDQKLDEKK